MEVKAIDRLLFTLVAVGGLNWGLVGLFDFNLVDTIFGVDSLLARVVYIVVGISALYLGYAIVNSLSSKKA